LEVKQRIFLFIVFYFFFSFLFTFLSFPFLSFPFILFYFLSKQEVGVEVQQKEAKKKKRGEGKI